MRPHLAWGDQGTAAPLALRKQNNRSVAAYAAAQHMALQMRSMTGCACIDLHAVFLQRLSRHPRLAPCCAGNFQCTVPDRNGMVLKDASVVALYIAIEQ